MLSKRHESTEVDRRPGHMRPRGLSGPPAVTPTKQLKYKKRLLPRYFVKEHFDSKHKYSEDDIIKMLEFLVDNISVVFVGKVFQQIVGIPMGTNCAPFLADIFLYSYEAEFIQSVLSTGRKQ